MYEITNYTRRKAKELHVEVKPSSIKKKKVDVFKYGRKVASVGAIRYSDFPTYLKNKGEVFANKRRKLYKARHSNDLSVFGSNGYYADKLLW